MSETSQARYAVYYAPPRDGELWQLAQSWLGRDCETGTMLAPPALEGWSAEDIATVTQSPRRYGFHATLKAPFRLLPGRSPGDLYAALGAFAGRRRPFQIPALKVSAIGPFLALTLSARSPEMEDLAAAAVQELDSLRAPLSAQDLQRRLDSDLNDRQRDLLHRWGYPYVLDEFRFHMTLTGPVADAERRQALQTKLAALFRPLLKEPVPVHEICLYSQEAPEAPFALVERFGFGRGAASAAKGGADSLEGPAVS